MSQKNPRVLFVTEFSGLNVGYGVYANHIINGVFNKGLEVAELAVGVNQQYVSQCNIPWKVYPSVPTDENEKKQHDSTMCAEFGAYNFEKVLLDYKPTHICDWRDVWHWEYQLRCPFRNYFAHIGMPAVDAEPQNKQWIDLYEQCDAVLGYTKWGMDLIKKSSNKIKVAGVVQPFAYKAYRPLPNRNEIKNQLGLGNASIIGMVGRNQKRKLFPDLFYSFSEFLKQSKRNDVYLYCHVGFPERGWAIDEEILKYNIQNKVLLGYICRKCKNMEIGLYQGPLATCYFCGERAKTLAGPECGFNHEQMNVVYNIIDLYVQWASNEGYGIPIMEAGACGAPVVAIDYSAMTEVTNNIGGNLIKPRALYQELESGRKFAVPDNEALISYMLEYFKIPSTMRDIKRRNVRKKYEENWNPEKIINKWIDTIYSVSPRKEWNSNIVQIQLPTSIPDNLNNQDFVRWCIINILGEPERVGTWFETRLLRDLDWGVSPGGFGGEYYNELSASVVSTKMQPFNREVIVQHFVSLAEKKNFWENQRVLSL